MKGMIILVVILLIFVEYSNSKQLICLTGYKILTRKQVTDIHTRQLTYKFEHQCLCPNNYYGKQCQNHIKLDCYLSANHKTKQSMVIDETNIKQEMDFQMNFLVDCWVGQRSRFNKTKTKLTDYLQQHNTDNAFGIRQQFGKGVDIVWANTTTNIFDQQGEFKLISQMSTENQTYQLTEQQKLKILIGNNTELYHTPFVYESDFLGYGLINGNVQYRLRAFDPERGMISLRNYTSKDVTVIKNAIADNLPSRRVTQQQTQQNDLKKKEDDNVQKDQQTTDQSNDNKKIPFPVIDKDSSISDYADQYSKYVDFFSDNPLKTQSANPFSVKLKVKINPYNSTFYSAIKLSLVIAEKYQQILTHSISLNSFDYTIPVNVPNIGSQPLLSKNLVISSQSYKTYYKIILVVGVMVIIYFALTIGYRKWKLHKQKSLQLTEQQINLQSNLTIMKK